MLVLGMKVKCSVESGELGASFSRPDFLLIVSGGNRVSMIFNHMLQFPFES